MRILAAVTICADVALGFGSSAVALDVGTGTNGSSYQLSAREWQAAVAAHAAASAAGDPVAVLVEYARDVQCNVTTVPLTTVLNGPCGGADGFVAPLVCQDGASALEPLWTRTRTAAGAPWTAWTYVATGACPQDLLPAFTTADFQRRPLTPT
ncbi:MAG: hypothetical protein HHJ14_07800, partial [Cellulomonas sp.]|nr:hypothetical protein [Cellulomonas sp.]